VLEGWKEKCYKMLLRSPPTPHPLSPPPFRHAQTQAEIHIYNLFVMRKIYVLIHVYVYSIFICAEIGYRRHTHIDST
jgi:hypothetical protein